MCWANVFGTYEEYFVITIHGYTYYLNIVLFRLNNIVLALLRYYAMNSMHTIYM